MFQASVEQLKDTCPMLWSSTAVRKLLDGIDLDAHVTVTREDRGGGPEKLWSGHWSCFGHRYAIEASLGKEDMFFIMWTASRFIGNKGTHVSR